MSSPPESPPLALPPPLVPPPLLAPAELALRLELQALVVELGRRTLRLLAPCVFQAGRLYLVSGPSGSGKSSFARALLGFGELAEPRIPCAGDIVLHHGPDRRTEIWQWGRYHPQSREQIAFLPQAERLGFIDALTTLDNLRLFSRLGPAEASAAARQLAERFHLSGLPRALSRASGGERIRLSAVRGLLPRRSGEGPPPLVLCDEPTAGLDPRAAKALAGELIALAEGGESIVVVITHEPQLFVPSLPDGESASAEQPGAEREAAPRGVRLIECTLGNHATREAREIGLLLLEQGHPRDGALSRAGAWVALVLQSVGGVALAPLAFLWGLPAALRRPRATIRQVLGDALAPGTLLFTLTGTQLVAGTVAYFIFEQTPRPELVEPLLLPEILRATGHTLVRVVLPLGTCALVATKLGAAQGARLAAAVRSGLLETLALARWRVEGYALVPAVLAQVLCMLLATGFSLVAGLATAALVYSVGHERAPIWLALDLMLAGLQEAPRWFEFLCWKVICSGFLGGTLAALFGHAPTNSEEDVARAVHRTLLWGVLCVIACQCAFIIAEFAGAD